jgi:hypothetical protein
VKRFLDIDALRFSSVSGTLELIPTWEVHTIFYLGFLQILHLHVQIVGPWCNGNTALCKSRGYGFDLRRVHSPLACARMENSGSEAVIKLPQ